MLQGTPINVVALPAHGEHWIVIYDDRHTSDALRQLGEWASRDDLSLSWYDAARLAQRIREARERNNV